MKYDLILVRYGELALKSPYVRKIFESTLATNIRNALASYHISCHLHKDRDRMYVRTDAITPALDALSRVFGITSFSPAFETEATLDHIGTLAQKITSHKLSKDTSFSLRVTRTGTHPFSSQDAAVTIGNVLRRKTTAIVNLTSPDVIIFIEIRNDKAYLFFERRSGTGGMPLETQGTVLALIDDAYSLLAVWYLMRRGCHVLVFTTKEIMIKQSTSFLDYWFQKPTLFVSKSLHGQENEEINHIIKEHNCSAVVTGHTLSENPEETIRAIGVLKSQLSVPVLTPLISLEPATLQQKGNEVLP